jgi:hypothetical protein
MIETTRIVVGYDENEDRIFVDCSDAEASCRLWLTRRITGRLLRAFVDLLERSNPSLLKTPADMRQDVIAFEHLSAISRPEPPPGAGAGQAVADSGAALLHRVDVDVLPEAFRLVFHAATEPKAGLTINRTEFHKTLALLDQCATAAEWDVGGATEWLRAADAPSASDKLAS